MNQFEITIFEDAAKDPKKSSFGKVITCKSMVEIDNVAKDKAWSPSIFENNHRKIDSFLYSDLLALDFDEKISIEDAKKRLQELGYIFSLTYSRNHQKIKNKGTNSEKPACDRFRVVIPLSKRVHGAENYLATILEIYKHFSEADSQCLDVARFYFPSTGVEK